MSQEQDDLDVTPVNNGKPSRKPGTFRKGDPRINRKGAPPKGEYPPDMPQLLRDLRHVYTRPASADTTHGQKMLRKLSDEKPDKFFYRLQKAEAEYRELTKQKAPQQPPKEETDVGSENVVRLVDNFLDGREEQRAQEDAEFAKRPDAAAIGATLQVRLAEALRREEELRREVETLRRQA